MSISIRAFAPAITFIPEQSATSGSSAALAPSLVKHDGVEWPRAGGIASPDDGIQTAARGAADLIGYPLIEAAFALVESLWRGTQETHANGHPTNGNAEGS